MQTAVALDARDAAGERAAALPWYVVAMMVGATSIVVGIVWDISWHRSIGRDTFWTPPHMATYLGGLIGGLGGGWLALRNTFGAGDAATVRFWGFRAPLGAWVAIWGALAMLASAPFDDWWHNAYGLDVKIISPPHMVLAAGILAIVVAAMLLALAEQNRASAPGRGGAAYLYATGLLVTISATLLMEYTRANKQHGALFYAVCCAVFPLVLVAAARAGRRRWPATAAAGVYLVFYLLTIWILPLFPAQPMLGPIYNPVDYMVPPSFPLLLVAPAVAIDLLLRRFGRDRDWALAAALAVTFFALFLAVQWFFAAFLISPGAENWFFGSDRNWDYDTRPGPWQTRFWGEPIGLEGVAIALALALASSRLGLWWGNWMARVRR